MTEEKKFTEDESTSVRRIKYVEETEILEVEFNNHTVYHYYEVKVGKAMELFKSEKIGQAIATKIKGNYNYRKISLI